MNTMTTTRPTGCLCEEDGDRCATCRLAAAAMPRTTRKTAPALPTALLIDAREVAGLLTIGVRTLWRCVAQGKVPQPIRFTRKLVRWRRSDIERHVGGLAAGKEGGRG